MAEHKIHCPSCAQHLSVPEELAGQLIDCPSCKKPMTLPDYAHAFDEEEEWAEEPSRQSPALMVGIVAGVLVFAGVGFFLLKGPDQSAPGPEVASLTVTQSNPSNLAPPNLDDEKAGSTKQQQEMMPYGMPGGASAPGNPVGIMNTTASIERSFLSVFAFKQRYHFAGTTDETIKGIHAD